MKCWTHFFIFITGLLCLSNPVSAQVDSGLYRLAPQIKISKWFKVSSNPEIQLKGKTVVLEFWATWCNPCVRAIPHLNSLAGKFKSDSVVFISLTKETSEAIENFLKVNTMETFVALDDSGKTNTNFNVKYIPKTFVIDSRGNIAWEGHPGGLKESILYSIINKNHFTQKEE